ncbi:MAG: hypothetical protein ABI408_06375 [Gemmatimonadaceae bacterium]
MSINARCKGSVWLDDLALTPLDPDSPFDVAPPDPSNPIVGSWETLPSHNSLGSKLDFGSDGSFTSILGVMAGLEYAVDGSRLRTSFVDLSGKSPDYTTSIRISHDTLYRTGTDLLGKDLVMMRVHSAAPHDNTIGGVWWFADSFGAVQFVAFGQNGRGLFRLPRMSCSGTWTASGGRLTVTLNGSSAERAYSIDKGVLTVTSADGRQIQYKRQVPP